ncbi:hypothetical protein [Domibacillus iocasae]|uniref:hypothetical protein n=1 Tax=Domibacillus iocasae TaxID=1714016 RepID=UPI00114D055C|nr:hypothetical protein [Domibacillus iocasae]
MYQTKLTSRYQLRSHSPLTGVSSLLQRVEKVDVTDVHVSWIYLNENAKDLSAAKLAQMSVTELVLYVA